MPSRRSPTSRGRRPSSRITTSRIEAWRERSFAPYPLAAWAEFTFDGVPIRLGQVVQTLARVTGVGGVYEPLVVTPAIGVRVEPEARILPLDGSPLPVSVTVHARARGRGNCGTEAAGGLARPIRREREFQLKSAGDTEPLVFSVSPAGDVKARAYAIEAVAHVGREKLFDWLAEHRLPGTAALQPIQGRGSADAQGGCEGGARIARGLRDGNGRHGSRGHRGAGHHAASALGDEELASGDLSQWNVIVIGIRAYSARPELAGAEPRLEQFVERGGTLVVAVPERHVSGSAAGHDGPDAGARGGRAGAGKAAGPRQPAAHAGPIKITAADFDGWFEERGHGFPDSWDAGYTALTETADPGQDPQRGGLLVSHRGKGTYIYVAFALYRQLPELVPGAYRLLANLLSAGKEYAGSAGQSQP